MSHIDIDNETILDTLGEIAEFARMTTCKKCRDEAIEMLEFFASNPNAKPVGICFTTTCSH